jgi:hypothetical protein
VAALGPYLSGAKFHNRAFGYEERHAVLNEAPGIYSSTSWAVSVCGCWPEGAGGPSWRPCGWGCSR